MNAITTQDSMTPDQLIEGRNSESFSKVFKKRKPSKATAETYQTGDNRNLGGLPSGLFSNLDGASAA